MAVGLHFHVRPRREGASVQGSPLGCPEPHVPLPPTPISCSGHLTGQGLMGATVGLGPHWPGTVAPRKEPVCLETPQVSAGPGGLGEARASQASEEMDFLGVRACRRGLWPLLKGLAGSQGRPGTGSPRVAPWAQSASSVPLGRAEVAACDSPRPWELLPVSRAPPRHTEDKGPSRRSCSFPVGAPSCPEVAPHLPAS